MQIEDVTEQLAALALQGPMSRKVLEALTGEDWSDVRYFGRRGPRRRRWPWTSLARATRATWATSCGWTRKSALGVWDALMAAGGPFGIRPAGISRWT